MFLSKTNCFLKSKIRIGYIDECNRYIQQGRRCFLSLNTCDYNTDTRHSPCVVSNKRKYLRYYVRRSFSNSSTLNTDSYRKSLAKKSDVFGDLAFEKYEKLEMDEDEEEEEEFGNNVERSSSKKMSTYKYTSFITGYIKKGDLKLALHVLQMIKDNNDRPTRHMFKLLIYAFAWQGDIKQCFKLYNKMKGYGFVPSQGIYNSLINACATSKNKDMALGYLQELREFFYKTNYPLNETHYMTLVKAYGWQKEIETAFEIADEAYDKHVASSGLYACLFHAAISDKQNGLKYVITLWHYMKKSRIEMTITHYNLLLKAIKDTNFGNLKVHDALIPKFADTQIELTETGDPDLLDSPPRIRTILFSLNKKPAEVQLLSSSLTPSENNLEKQLVEKSAVMTIYLNDIVPTNRLTLFGGFEKLLRRMEHNNVEPDIKTVTLLLELLPPSIEAEELFLVYIKHKNIKVDISFFNMLIKKRNMRKMYKEARDVLYKIQCENLVPNIMTFGVLAIGCIKLEDGMELLKQMNNIGLEPNSTVLETLLFTACYHSNFNYILELLNYMLKHKTKPTKAMYEYLNKFEKLILGLMNDQTKFTRKEIRRLEKDYKTYKILYEDWKQKIQKPNIVRMK